MAQLRDLLTREIQTLTPVAGVNGPYGEEETRVRNLSHYISGVCLAEKQSIDTSKNTLNVHDAMSELLNPKNKPMNATYWCRSNPQKDFCNGVMGQAWVLEALILYAQHFKCGETLSEAIRLYRLHPYSEIEMIWQRVAVDGMILPFDSTLNHQLWFAAISSMLPDEIAKRRSERFLDFLLAHLTLYRCGIIKHTSPLGCHEKKIKAKFKKSRILYNSIVGKSRQYLYNKSIGYHAFNLYALAILKEKYPHHSFWTSKKFNRMLNVTKSENFIKSVSNNKYGMYYNPSGIELCFVGEVFNVGREYCERYLKLQMDKTYSSDHKKILVNNSLDFHTSSARIYEALRIKDVYAIDK